MIYVASLHSDRPHPCLIVIGGEDDDGKILNDCWILELQTVTWKHVSKGCFSLDISCTCNVLIMYL